MNKKKEYNEDLLYQIAKIIAESDSIGEMYSYCVEYTKELFSKGLTGNPSFDYPWTEYVDVAKQIYNLFTKFDNIDDEIVISGKKLHEKIAFLVLREEKTGRCKKEISSNFNEEIKELDDKMTILRIKLKEIQCK